MMERRKYRVTSARAARFVQERREYMRRARTAAFYVRSAWSGDSQRLFRELLRTYVTQARACNRLAIRSRFAYVSAR
jgi:hypothetical protein